MRRWFFGCTVLLAALVVVVPGAHAQEMEFEPDELESGAEGKTQPPPKDNVPPSPTMEQARKKYQKKQFYSASIEFGKVIGNQTQDGPANKQRAEFFLGKTLYSLEYYAAALAYFDRIVEQGTGHIYYGPTLKWLAALSRVLPETSGILEKIGRYDVADLEQPIMEEVRDELYFLLGRHFFQRGKEGDFEQAISLFQSVSQSSPFFVRAKFFEGVTYVRQLKGKPAVEAFKDILVIAEERPKFYSEQEINKYQELAWLQLARVFYSTQQYDTSIKYYEKLSQASPDWLPSLFEASWAYFMKFNYSKALGNIHTLTAPYFENEFFAESILLRSVIYYEYCLYDRALEAVNEFQNTYKPLREDLRAILNKYEDDAEFYEYVKKIMAGTAGLSEPSQNLAMSALSDRTLRKTLDWVDELGAELQQFEKADSAWKTTGVASDIQTELTLQQSLAAADAGKLARARLERLNKELQQLTADSIKINIEILEKKAGQIETRERGGNTSGVHRSEPIVVDDEHFMWRFNGEYWKDELGFYRFKVRSTCPKKK